MNPDQNERPAAPYSSRRRTSPRSSQAKVKRESPRKETSDRAKNEARVQAEPSQHTKHGQDADRKPRAHRPSHSKAETKPVAGPSTNTAQQVAETPAQYPIPSTIEQQSTALPVRESATESRRALVAEDLAMFQRCRQLTEVELSDAKRVLAKAQERVSQLQSRFQLEEKYEKRLAKEFRDLL